MVKSSLFAWALRTSYPRPTNGIAEGYARTVTGHTAAPPSSVMNSRRLMLDMGTSSPVGLPHPQPAAEPTANPWARPELF
jgi:hypothetical protein